MELIAICCVVVVTLIIAFYVWRVLNLLWFEPKKTEKFLRDQGLGGTSYRFMYGDLKEFVQLMVETSSKPMSLSNDIAPRVIPFFYKAVTTYGKNCFTWMGPKPLVHISEPTMIRDILADRHQFQKTRGENPFLKMLPRGLDDAQGDQWLKHRKMINPAFHLEKLKHMAPAIYVSCTEMIHKWEEMLSGKSSCEVDVWPHLQTLSGDVISHTAFGSNFEEGRKIFDLQREQIKLVIKASQSFYFPGLRFLPTKNNKRMKENDVELKALIRKIIDKRVDAMKLGETSNGDLLGILLDSNYKEIKEGENYSLSIQDVIENCKLFYFAGQETTANMLVWTMILLGQHLDWQTHAREEVLHVFGKKIPDIDGLSRLKIINMIFNEVLRLYPPAPILRRTIDKDIKIGNLRLQAQTQIQINLLLVHHDHDIWGDDAHVFNPERFSEGMSNVTKGEMVYFPFGGGPRICIGRNFSMLEAKMALAMILQGFSFELSPSYSHAPYTLITMHPQFGAHLILHKL